MSNTLPGRRHKLMISKNEADGLSFDFELRNLELKFFLRVCLLAPLLSLFPFLKNKTLFPKVHTCLRSTFCLVYLCRNKNTFADLCPTYFCPLYTLFQIPIVPHGYASSKAFVNDKVNLPRYPGQACQD